MTTQGIAIALGNGIKFKGYSFSFTDLQTTAGAGAKTFNVTTLTQGSFILYIRVKHSVAFAGGALSAMTVSIGKSGAATNFFVAAFNVFQAVADTTLSETATPAIGQLSSCTVTITFTPTGDTCANVTAGIVQVDIAQANVTTPTYTGLYSSGAVL
jgi:hypothetical protein